MNRRDSLLAALVATIWGFNFVVIDWGMSGMPPLLFAAVRFTAVILPAIFLVPRPAASWRVVAAVGAFMSLGQFGFLYVSMAAGMPPGLAALVLQAQVIFTVVIAAGVLRELPTAAQTAGVGIGVAGLVVVAVGRGGHVPATALALCLLAALSWGVGNVISRSSGIAGGLSLTVWSAVVSCRCRCWPCRCCWTAPPSCSPRRRRSRGRRGSRRSTRPGSPRLVGYGIFNTLLSRNPSAAVVPWVLLAPVVAMGSAWVLLGQRPNLAETLGGLVLILGVLVALRSRQSAALAAVAIDPQLLPSADRPASSRATGTRNGEHET